uniref:Adaptor AP-1 19 kDa protein n=2 Tax=Populus alba TaxID=43335 RepID=A0A4U5QZN4_POPAL|nr:AP-1 complex subunit sigma-1 [Populus alba]
MCLTEIYMTKIAQPAAAGWCNALKAGSWAAEIEQELARDQGITRHLHLEIVISWLGGRATRDQGSRRWGTSTRCFADRYRVLSIFSSFLHIFLEILVSGSITELLNTNKMIQFVLLISRQGKVRLTKWYSPYTQKERSKVIRELSGVILSRGPKLCNFVEWRGLKVVYKRYASLYFCMCIDQEDNELEVLEIIHHYVEILDRYFGSVCELDLIFNFHKAYYVLDELLIAGELQESSKKTVARQIAAQDSLVEAAKEQASSISNIISQATK